ncbi:MAG: GNAT family N-acetyltransferase [Actinomycetes bacterium]
MDVELRPVLESDLPSFYAHQSDPVACAIAGFPARVQTEFFAHWHRILVDPGVKCRAIVADDVLVGNVVAFDLDGHREVGYWLDRPQWGNGIATAALRAFLAIELLRPLHGNAAVTNLGSIRVLEKCGFRLDHADSQRVDLVLD